MKTSQKQPTLYLWDVAPHRMPPPSPKGQEHAVESCCMELGLRPRAGTPTVCYVAMLVAFACISHWTTSPWRAACSTHGDSVPLPRNMTNAFPTLFLRGFTR